MAGPAHVPGFIPWDEANRRETRQCSPFVASPTPVGVIVGAMVVGAMAAIILPKLERGVRSNKMRRCMAPRL